MTDKEYEHAKDIITMIYTARTELERVMQCTALNQFQRDQRMFELTNLINNVLKTEATELLEDIANKKAA